MGFDPSTTIILVETKSRAFYTFTSCGAFVHKLWLVGETLDVHFSTTQSSLAKIGIY